MEELKLRAKRDPEVYKAIRPLLELERNGLVCKVCGVKDVQLSFCHCCHQIVCGQTCQMKLKHY